MVRPGMSPRGLACLGVLAFVLNGTGPRSHPIHTTFTEIVQSTVPGKTTVTIRGFADDLTAASLAGSPLGQSDSALVQYLQQRVALTDAQGRRITLELGGIRRTSDLLWFTFETAKATDLRGGRFANSVLTERHSDQVNLVQIRLDGRTRTLLFTPGDGAKSIGN
jgi:hypothetical protein